MGNLDLLFRRARGTFIATLATNKEINPTKAEYYEKSTMFLASLLLYKTK
jgi:hypothetical protein